MSDPGSLLRLQTVGRKSGRPHSVLLRYVTYDGRIVVFPQKGSSQDWVKNLSEGPAVVVHANGKAIEGVASVKESRGLDDPRYSVFTRKYGTKVVRDRYWGQTTYIEIEPRSESPVDLDELVYGDLEAAFDGVAENYDHHILDNPMNLWLRNRSVDVMTRVFRPGETILEIGCGTGTETLVLARKGIKVIASDISSKMLEVLARKASAAGLGGSIVPVHSRPYELNEKLALLGYHQVDGVYSTYGAVNTEPRLAEMFSTVQKLLRPGGKLVLGVWNRYCLYEILGYSLKLRPSMAIARFRNPVPVGKSRFCIASNAYSVSGVSDVLGAYELEEVIGVGILLPPSNLLRYLPPGRLLGLFKRADAALQAYFPWNRLGDHFIGVYSLRA
ncbi:MAG: nitroreductase family deazaflavin-dependent oxidoreductase [archaeon]|nr:MAG: nitroreductase family deazaflavin-dependent oxidoreductase [archaeon]